MFFAHDETKLLRRGHSIKFPQLASHLLLFIQAEYAQNRLYVDFKWGTNI